MKRIVLVEKGENQELFKEMNLFCQECYQKEGILEKNAKFEGEPDIFLGVVDENCHCLGTLGMKFAGNGSPSLPVERCTRFSLPSKERFLSTSFRTRVEFMRFSLQRKIKRKEKILVTEKLFDAAVEFFAPAVEIPLFELESIAMFAFTFKEVAHLFNLAVKMKVFKEVKAEILVDQIPPQSRVFLKKKPKVFYIPSEVIARRWEKIRNSTNPLGLAVSF